MLKIIITKVNNNFIEKLSKKGSWVTFLAGFRLKWHVGQPKRRSAYPFLTVKYKTVKPYVSQAVRKSRRAQEDAASSFTTIYSAP